MKPINLLVIDDDKKAVERAMRHLKRHDEKENLGKYIVDDSIMAIDRIESYSPSVHAIEFDAVLIDYQLIGQQFTGILVSAWMILQLGIPRIALTTATYNGPRNYFDEYIRKDEIIDNPKQVIHKIVSCIENFNYSQWLNDQYKELMNQYSDLMLKSEQCVLIPPEAKILEKLEALLDKYERILDSQQEERIKAKLEYLETKSTFREKEVKHEQIMQDLQSKLDEMLSRLEAESK